MVFDYIALDTMNKNANLADVRRLNRATWKAGKSLRISAYVMEQSKIREYAVR